MEQDIAIASCTYLKFSLLVQNLDNEKKVSMYNTLCKLMINTFFPSVQNQKSTGVEMYYLNFLIF